MSMSLATILKELNKKYEGCIISGADYPDVQKIPLNRVAFDYVSTGGVPVNRITQFLGLESSTKTLHALWAVAAFQRVDWDSLKPGAIRSVDFDSGASDLGFHPVKKVHAVSRRVKNPKFKYCVWLDTEGTFDRAWAEKQGVWLDGLIYLCPSSLEQGIDIVQTLLLEEDVSLVVVDSMSAVGAEMEVEASMEDHQMAANARFWNKALRKVQASLNASEGTPSVIFINTYSTNVGAFYGDPNTPKNGNGVRYAATINLEFVALKKLQDKKGDVLGRNIKLSCTKNKAGQPFRNFYTFLSLYEGSDKSQVPYGTTDEEEALVRLAAQMDIVSSSGSWFSYGSVKAQGIEKFKEELIKTGTYADVEQEVRKAL